MLKKISYKPLLLIGISFMSSCALLAPVDRGKYSDVVGHVFSLDTNGPIPNAQVNVIEQSSAENTDRNGKFYLRGLPVEWLTVEIKAPGYETVTRRVKIEPYGDKYIDFWISKNNDSVKSEKIVFERAGDIWLTDEYGINQTNLTEKIKNQSFNTDITSTLFFNSPVWFANKTKIAYILNDGATNPNTKNGLWVMSSAGKLSQRITYIDSQAFKLSVNNTGNSFIFSMIDPDNSTNTGLYKYSNVNNKMEALSGGYISKDMSPKWSPKSNMITYASSLTEVGNISNLYDVNEISGPRTQIFTMNSTGLSRKQLTFSGENNDPSWSPDGDKITFISNRSGSSELWLMNKDGSGQRRLTDTGATRATNPTWSSDGQRIIFNTNYKQKYSSTYPSEVWVFEPSTYNLRMISNDASNPNW
ncbi:MAG: PD40 domain-containing protein [Candidatus Sericytochromatia bacterium]|nr:PD40 domain-containing protein [Candidatus Sericytochromatia bacterium]